MNNQQVEKLVSDYANGHITRRDFIKAAVALGLSASGVASLLASCAPAPAPTPPPAQPAVPSGPTAAPVVPTVAKPVAGAGPVRFLIAENFWADWTPYMYSAQSQGRVVREIYDRLVEARSPKLDELSPGLATSWKIVDDLTWEFKLRQGVKFHNGGDFTADDVKASVELATSPNTLMGKRWKQVNVDIVDKYTVRLKTKEPYGPLLVDLTQVEILSAKDIMAGGDNLKRNANGTGPFRLAKDEPERKVMEAFTGYWGGAPAIQSLVWEFVQEPQTRLSAMMAGQAHAIDRVPPEHLGVISNSPDFALASVPGMEMVVLWFQYNPKAPWENPDFRRAIAWSVDREALARDLVKGQSKFARSYLPDSCKFFQPQEPAYTFNKDKAKEYLAKAGMADGGPEFELWVAQGFQPRAKEVGEAMINTMKQVGLKPKLVVTDLAGLINAIGLGKEGAFRMIHISWSGNGDPDRQLRGVYYDGGVLWKKDEKTNQLIDAGSAAVQDADRAKIYGDLQRYMWDTVPSLQLYTSDFTVGYTKKLEGMLVLPNFTTDFAKAALKAV